nr:hypothetical protein [Paenibacillus sp. Marseille-P2973]
MCYGPEIEVIYETIRKNPGLDTPVLRNEYQYDAKGDISSLIDSVLTILEDLQFIRKEEKGFVPTEGRPWSNIEVFSRLQVIAHEEVSREDSLNYIFASLYEQFFVRPDRMFVTNLHYLVNRKFTKTLVGHEKINAWKRMMECWGLGRRVYSGFYALPHLSLLKQIIMDVGEWEGGLHPFCETKIHPTLPCITAEGNIFKGIIFGLMALHERNRVEISYKQDLPYKSYGPKSEWNWIQIGKQVETYDTLFE